MKKKKIKLPKIASLVLLCVITIIMLTSLGGGIMMQKVCNKTLNHDALNIFSNTLFKVQKPSQKLFRKLASERILQEYHVEEIYLNANDILWGFFWWHFIMFALCLYVWLRIKKQQKLLQNKYDITNSSIDY